MLLIAKLLKLGLSDKLLQGYYELRKVLFTNSSVV